MKIPHMLREIADSVECMEKVLSKPARTSCPFVNNMAVDYIEDEEVGPTTCVYMQGHIGVCDDVFCCPGNSDAWCIQMINKGIESISKEE